MTFTPFVKEDSFSMESLNNKFNDLVDDFNADNAKLDAALTTLSTTVENLGTELLQTLTIDVSAVTQTVPLTALDWSKYQYVRLDFALTASATDLLVRPNDSTDCSYAPFSGSYTQPTIAHIAGNYPCSLYLLCGRDAARNLLAVSVSYNGGVGYSKKLSFSQLEALSIFTSSDSTSITGGTVKIWGIR